MSDPVQRWIDDLSASQHNTLNWTLIVLAVLISIPVSLVSTSWIAGIILDLFY